MRIILRVYKEIRMGNLSTMIIDIPNNNITIRELKEKIYKKYKIKPSEQKLTFRQCHKRLITLTDSFPLNYFYIKENAMIFLEILSNEPQPKPEEIKKIEKRNSAMYKYMNMLGYFLPDSKTFQKPGIGDRFKKIQIPLTKILSGIITLLMKMKKVKMIVLLLSMMEVLLIKKIKNYLIQKIKLFIKNLVIIQII